MEMPLPSRYRRVLDSKGDTKAPKFHGKSSLARRKGEFSVPPSMALPLCFLKEKGTQHTGAEAEGGRELPSPGDTTLGRSPIWGCQPKVGCQSLFRDKGGKSGLLVGREG